MSIAGLFGERAKRDHDRLMALARHDEEVGATMPDPAVETAIKSPGLSYRQIIADVLEGYGDRPAMATRDYRLITDAQTGRRSKAYEPRFRKISYAELRRQIEAIAAAWQGDPINGVQTGAFVALLGFTGAELNAIDLACVYAGAYSVPLQGNLDADALLEIMGDVAPSCIVCNLDYLDAGIFQAIRQKSVRSFVIVDAEVEDEDDRDAVENARRRLADEAPGRIAVLTYAELVASGEGRRYQVVAPPAEGDDALSMLCYTSGSTGSPKGALIHEAICKQFWANIPTFRPTISVCYAPINHFMGRIQVHNALAQGGIAYFSLKSDLSTLLDDIRIARPTQLILMPRFAEMIYQHYLSERQRLVLNGVDEGEADRRTRADMKDKYLGGRLLFGTVGSSPTAPEVAQFIDSCFDIQVVNGYGSTEQGTGTVAANGVINWNFVIDYKLKDVPELGYYTTDKPYPRGELLSRTRYQIKGYFKRPEATASIFDDEGYVLTGDIVEQRDRDHIVWLDRRNNVIKLSQAEFVAIGPLEALYLADNPLFGQIYIYGNSRRAFLLAVVVPDVRYAEAQLGNTPDDDALRALVMAQFQVVARRAHLKSFEIPREVLIEREPFTHENGLLTSARKPSRPNLKARYADRLEAIYARMDTQQRDELARLRGDGDDVATVDRVAGAIKASLGLAGLDPENSQSYRDLGGDSLGAAGLSVLLEEMFGVGVPVAAILDPAGSVRRIADVIDRARDAGSGRIDCATIHGENADMLAASDLKLGRFIDAATLMAAATAPLPAGESRTVLLTGATGFLGRFLCLEWMQHLADHGGGRVVCIVRARDDADAMARLNAAIGDDDPDLRARFDGLAACHLEVVAGDLAAPALGLDASTYDRLSEEVDQIVHCGALVNHLLSYQNLFEPNVLGTAELVRLALLRRRKRFDFISTVGVPMLNDAMRSADEDVDPRTVIPALSLGANYAMGYAASKWAGEILLREVHDAFGLPVKIFRPDMILAHAAYRGQINVPDMFTRLLLSIALTGLAPSSFYERNGDGGRPKAHYDGLPGDFVAATIQEIGSLPSTSIRCYNVINTNDDDGISLDTIVDWIESAGYAIVRIEDHAEWLRRLREKLSQLDDDVRTKTSIDILHSFLHPHSPRPSRLRSNNYERAVRSSAVGPQIARLTEAFIHKYLNDMKGLGLFASLVP